MKDNFGREIDYLRISVTDRCNLRCIYCMPEDGFYNLIPHSRIMTFEEIYRITKAAAKLGIKKVRLTGGEPLLRRGIVDLVRMLRSIDGIEEIAATTNALLLEELANDLKDAGLNRVNISLDTMDKKKYARITRGGDVDKVFRGIDRARDAGLTPIKINVVALGGFNDDEFENFIELTRKEDISVRFIEYMPIGQVNLEENYGFISNQSIIDRFPELKPVKKNEKSVSEDYRLPDGKGKVGFISAMSNHFCADCNKLRLTSEGHIKPCLHSNEEIDMMDLLRVKGGSDEELYEMLKETLDHKVERHMMNDGANPIDRDMNKIGG